MATNTTIAWCDHTHNPWQGCTKVSPGCDRCYAETLDHRWGGDHWGKGKERKILSDANWHKPVLWNKAAAKAGEIKKVFCGSMCDVMDDEAPAGERERLWALINSTPNLFWQLLTKRPVRYKRYLPLNGFAHDNVILGATMEAQKYFDHRMPILHMAAEELYRRNYAQRVYAARVQTFVSYEPALGPIDMNNVDRRMWPSWLIFGGETGNDPRPMQREWAANIKQQCEEADVPFFMKQFSARTPEKAAELIPVEMLLRQFPQMPPIR